MIVLAADLVGCRVVEHLIERSYPVEFVVTHPSDRGGYNAAIRQAAESAGREIRLVSSEELLSDSLLDDVSARSPRIGILAWWPSIIKGRVLSIPQMGWLNLHPSLLPFNRGKNPNFWCLVDEHDCGVSLQLIDGGVDTGPIVAQAAFPVTWEDTGETVYHKSREQIIELFKDNFERILSGDLQPRPQAVDEGTSHRAVEMETASIIDVDAPTTARRVLNVIRARMFAPHPTARFTDGEKTYSVTVEIREIRADD